ncbi:hypothetical protein MMC30_000296 [Trapelia coarctata]|nr:hypothetical protein [Trapelia coarctata]
MSERRRASSKPKGEVIVRYHSPYCESTGPIVVEGTVAARIQAFQNAQRTNEAAARPHSPVSSPPHCRLTPDWRPHSALESPVSAVSGGLELQRAHSQLANYVRNEPELREEVTTGIVHNKSLIFGTPLGTPRSRRKSISTPAVSTPGDRSRTPALSVDEESPAVDSPGLTRHSSWRKSVRPGSVVRSRKSIANIVKDPEYQPSTPASTTVNRQETWPEKPPVLKKAPVDRTKQISKHSRPQKSIAEQIGEMIDRALEGRSDSAVPSTMSRSMSEYTGFSGEVRKGKYSFSGQPQYFDQYTETPAEISPGAKRAVQPQGSVATQRSDEQPVPLKTGSIRSRRFDGRYSHTEETAYPRSQPDPADRVDRMPSPEPNESPRPTRPRARTYSHRHPPIQQGESHDTKGIKSRSISSPPSSCPRSQLSDNDQYQIYVRKRQERGDTALDENRGILESDRSRKPSLRSHSTKPRRRASSHHLSDKSHVRGTRQKKWKWWKLVLVDREGSRSGQSTTQETTENAESGVFRHGSHPLANKEHEDEGYETSDLVEALERACTEQLPSAVMASPNREGILSALAEHTLAECGHEDEKVQNGEDQFQSDVRLAVDGSTDSQRSRPTLTIASASTKEVANTNTQVSVVSDAHGARVEVKAGEPGGQGEGDVTRNFRGVKVVVTVEEGMDSAIVKVEIRPKKRW